MNTESQPPKDKGASTGEPHPAHPVAAKLAPKPAVKMATPSQPGALPPLFRKIDWITFGVSTLLVFVGYYLTLAPDLTLEDCGELAVASMYAGVPHPPGYPVWTIYTWLFTVLLPVSNIAFRVAVASALAGALGCGLLGLMVSRGSSLMIEGLEELKNLDRRWENAICLVTGYVAAMLMGFNGFMWSQSVIVEVYSLSVLSLTAVLCFLLRWMYAPHQYRYLFLVFFMFGICTTTHQTLILAAVGLEVAVAAANPRLGRDLFLVNSLVYVLVLILKARGMVTTFNNPADPAKPTMFFLLFNFIGIFSMAACAWLIAQTKKLLTEWWPVLMGTVLFCAGAAFYFYMPITSMSNPPLNWGYPRTLEGFKHALTRGQYERANPTDVLNDPGRFLQQLGVYFEGAVDEFTLVYLAIGLLPLIYYGVRIYREGGKNHLVGVGAATVVVVLLFTSMLLAQRLGWKGMLWPLGIFTGLALLADLVLLLVVTHRYMQKPERAWLVGLAAIYLCLAVMLMIMLNPSPDRQSRELTRVFFTSSHVLVCMAVGYGLTLLASSLATHYKAFRWPTLGGGIMASGIALYVVTVVWSDPAGFDVATESPWFDVIPSKDSLIRFTSVFSLGLGLLAVGILATATEQATMGALILVFAIMPVKSILSHWADNEQRGHLFGYWFGHDMFTPPFKDSKGQWSYDPQERKKLLAQGKLIYPEMDPDTVLFGGTDPGRFNPTYTIYCESFIPPEKKPLDPLYDRRDVYLITQNALADGTYLNYIRAHYNRSAQKDPPFFQEIFRRAEESGRNLYTNRLARLFTPLDRFFLKLGDNIEKRRRVGNSFFKESDFQEVKGLAATLASNPFGGGSSGTNAAPPPPAALVKYLKDNLAPETLALLSGGDEKALRAALARDWNRLLEKGPLFESNRFAGVRLSPRTMRFVKQDPQSHTRIRLNRLLLEEVFPKELAKSQGGVYPDLEIITPSPEDSQKAFQEYMEDAQRRLAAGQLRPGEDVRIDAGRVQVSGQVAVMSINALLTKVIFEKNPDHEFYVEESFPLDWMYPYLTPFGIIMKINRRPLPELSQEIIDRDHKFWSEYSERFIGDWIKYETPISNICQFAERVYLHRDYTGFQGDRKFIRDDNAQKAFSKLRSSIGGVYNWRIMNSRSNEERQRMIKEAEFAFKQALAFCPFSPEAVFRYVNLLLGLNQPARLDDALIIAETCKRLDPYNAQVEDLIRKLKEIKQNVGNTAQSQAQILAHSNAFRADPANPTKAFALAQAYIASQDPNRTNLAMQALESLLQQPKLDAGVVISIAKAFVDFNQVQRLEGALVRLTQLTPQSPEAWYDLAGVQAIVGRPTNALESLHMAIALSNARLKQDPKANNLILSTLKDERFNSLRARPEFQRLMDQK